MLEKRAEEALKKHVQEKNEAKIKEEMNKKLKADLITGGGFDLSKSKKPNQNLTKNNAQPKTIPQNKGKK